MNEISEIICEEKTQILYKKQLEEQAMY